MNPRSRPDTPPPHLYFLGQGKKMQNLDGLGTILHFNFECEANVLTTQPPRDPLSMQNPIRSSIFQAMHLVYRALEGDPVPLSIPGRLVPLSKRKLKHPSSAPASPAPAMAMPAVGPSAVVAVSRREGEI